ncbi:CPBP family intramembrane glutamic endopeptidase [Arthrospiribacter ruber]|uniref:CPBP family intramembrane metalloprotease n=1 Tax=Arthrospiribacter ruber TaxID=2487934 RepID=A0A951IU16_9BACT|nr:type II CAAX endopeptidase family protein [Arthrospiribacter ruber]MBW3466262.1 CPBP family intramembrane metalloprotease [Arthrospiribacter ruber]
MIELVFGLSIFLGLILLVHGIAVLYPIRKNLMGFVGLYIDKYHLKVIAAFLMLVFVLFVGLTLLNVKWNLISIERAFDLSALLKTVPSELSAVIFEELVFRVFIFSSLFYFTRKKVAALVLTALLFSFAHFPQNTLEVLSYFLGGIMYGYAFLKFQTVWVPIAIHFFWNFIQGPVLGFPVSGMEQVGLFQIEIVTDIFFNGGDQGPEGSVLGIMMRCIIILMIIFLKPGPPNPKFLQ